ncbi:hypothetical protein OS493_006924 [Desmophyllum pertusum]|uniref:Uncharacterized protein n=1 Tax=Desmophyllum pertusum TaxID=174260 RepID=A0A9W9ZT28_9CNID|nr:hypothetical protein OS493_006924 [Desmophyllum pertusum]
MKRTGKRTTKIPSTFKDFVSSDVQEKPMVEEEDWYLVQFEDKGQLFSVISRNQVHHISPDDMNLDHEEGDFVDAEWPTDGPKADMRVLRAKLEKEREAMGKGTNKKDNQRKEPKTSSSVQPTKKKSVKDKPVTKATAAKDAHDKKAHDEELEGKKKKREENKQKREDVERKRKAELEQAKEN